MSSFRGGSFTLTKAQGAALGVVILGNFAIVLEKQGSPILHVMADIHDVVWETFT